MTRLKKIAESVNLGNIINSNKAIDIISERLKRYNTNEVFADIAPGNVKSLLGLISDSGLIAAELYCFKVEPNAYVGAVVGTKLNVTDIANKQYTVDSNYDCVILNNEQPDIISTLKQSMMAGVDLCGIHCTFDLQINSIDELFEYLQDNENV